ncbi:uncharacterized protein [Eurosta solidaginis]|uniref:uncharacterized protein n=1 Tax=Eurosta solidaginis TaxID=178769 RepID=UPI00353069F5
MAASIYATPPPDLSSEDTALSDVSSASSTNNRSNNNTTQNNNRNCNSITTSNNTTTNSNPLTVTNKQKRNISEVLANQADQPTPPKRCNSASPKPTNSSGSTTSATIYIEEKEEAVDDTSAPRDVITVDDEADDKSTTSPNESASAATKAAVAAAANAAAMQLQLLEALSDAAKKRRKQHNPSRVGAQGTAMLLNEVSDGAPVNAAAAEAINADNEEKMEAANIPQPPTTTLPIDYEEKLSKMFLPKSMEQLKETFELLQKQQQQQFGNISTTVSEKRDDERELLAPQMLIPKTENDLDTKSDASEPFSDIKAPELHEMSAEELKNPYQTYCKTCGENFETEFKLSLHMLQEHANEENAQEHTNCNAANAQQQKSAHPTYDMLAMVNVKMEHPDFENSNSPPTNTLQSSHLTSTMNTITPNGKDAWLNAMPGIGFPFPPEAAAAAALSSSGYLPLLGMPGFPGVDGLNRPPLRIFNPEAYCDLCNKEFCNKYFLKTHKANKHGIYDPAVTGGSEGSGTNAAGGVGIGGANMNAMTQMLQLQMQQQQQQQRQQNLEQLQQKQQLALEEAQAKQLNAQSANGTAQQLTPPAPPPVYCDICSKRFTNVFAMRRHRFKAHEQPHSSPSELPNSAPTPQNSSAQSPKPEASTAPPLTELKNDQPNNNMPTDDASKQFQLPEGFRQDFTLEQEELAFTPQPRKLSPQSQQQARDANFAHDKLRRLGVLNPEAFCEICCKEYCNKYFLRTHKWKRHGIFVPPDELKDEQMQLMQKMSWPFMGLPGMPLNFMMPADKALMAQRMFAAANSATATVNAGAEHENQHLSKRIKLEQLDEEAVHANDENQENKCAIRRESSDQQQQLQQGGQACSNSVSSTPEPPHIIQAESYNSGANMPASPESAVGLQNLQKLQSMIQQLNDLNGKRPLGCHLCGREMENQYALQAHMISEHASLLDSSGPLPLNFQQHLYQQQQQLQAQQALKLSPSDSTSIVVPTLSEMRCNQCDRDFASIQEFKQHIAEVHLLTGSPLREGFVTPERPINPNAVVAGTRPPYTITPTSSYCEICNKELCNKYFMKTHMQRMHGIEIENGAQIGGVVCNICNKELCSKYFLRVHKHNTHGIVEEGAPLPQPRQNGLSFEAQQQQQQREQQQLQQQQQQLSSAENDYSRSMNLSPFGSGNSGDSKSDNANYTEVCTICTRRFRSAKWLRAHLLSDHGPAGIEKLRELEQQHGSLSKSASPTLKIPNGSASSTSSSTGGGSNTSNANSSTPSMLPNPMNLAQALQNLNAQHLLGNMPKTMLPGMFGAVAEQALQSPHLQEYQCSMCPFTTPYYAFLFIHERSHSLLSGGDGGDAVGELSVAPTEQLMGSSISVHEDKVASERKQAGKHKSEANNLVTTEKSHPSPSTQNNNGSTAEKGRLESTNLHLRTNTPTHAPSNGGSSKLKPSKENAILRNAKPVESKDNHKELTAKKSSNKVEKARTVATSPISAIFNTPAHEAISELANKSGKIASYALPKDVNASAADNGSEPEMQAFVLEAQQRSELELDAGDDVDEQRNRFVPAIVYLPVRKRISGPITVSFNLTPA